MRILDELGEELVRAARAAETEARTKATGRRSLRRRHHLPRAAVLGFATFLLLAAVAVAATLVIGRGDPIPLAPAGAVPRELQPVPGTARLNGLAVPDPDGGPAWDIRTSRSTTGATCATVGQIMDGDLGIVGLDRRFRVLPVGAADTCSTPQKTGATLAGARAFRGGGALQPITVVSGVVAPDVRRAVAVADGRRVTMALGPEGAFLAIFRGTPEQLRPRVALTGTSGQTTVLRFADTGEYLSPDPTGGAPWTLQRDTHKVAPGLRCIVARRERGPDSPQPLPEGSGAFVFEPASVPSRCGRAGSGFVAVKRFVPQNRHSWDAYYWSLNPSRTIAWGAAPRSASRVTARAAGVAARRIAVDPRSHGFIAVFDGRVDPRSVRITIDGHAQPAGADVVDRGGAPFASAPVPAWRSIASVLRKSAMVAEPFAADRGTVKIVRTAADPTGGPDWRLRTWTAHVDRRTRISPGMSREMRCFQAGLPATGGALRWPLAGGRTRTLGFTQRDGYCNDIHYLATKAAGPVVQTMVDQAGSADPRPVRVVVSGLLGAGVRSAQLLGAGEPRDLALGRDGAFLVVLGPEQAGRALRVRLVRSDGAVELSHSDGLEAPCRLSVAGSVRVADPDGAAPWAAGNSHVGNRHCRYVSQVVDGRLAWVDEDHETVRFSPGSFSSGTDRQMSRRAAVTIEVYGAGDRPQQPQGSPSPAQVARRTLPSRTLISGRARADVSSITLRTPRDVRTLTPVGGNYLAVYDGAFYGGEIVVTAHLRDGRDVTVRQPASRGF
jgi:hypothetical protein